MGHRGDVEGADAHGGSAPPGTILSLKAPMSTLSFMTSVKE